MLCGRTARIYKREEDTMSFWNVVMILFACLWAVMPAVFWKAWSFFLSREKLVYRKSLHGLGHHLTVLFLWPWSYFDDGVNPLLEFFSSRRRYVTLATLLFPFHLCYTVLFLATAGAITAAGDALAWALNRGADLRDRHHHRTT